MSFLADDAHPVAEKGSSDADVHHALEDDLPDGVTVAHIRETPELQECSSKAGTFCHVFSAVLALYSSRLRPPYA
jgi:hypothetical protein